MSRIGKKPLTIPANVEAKIDDSMLSIKGPKGVLDFKLGFDISAEIDGNQLTFVNNKITRQSKAFHGLARSVVDNMIVGVTNGYEIKLKIVGVGYKAELQGSELTVIVGYSHDVKVVAPEGIAFKLDNPQTIAVSGIDKAVVGRIAAHIREIKPAEPYNGKGIQYIDERVRRKAGKSGK